MTPKKPDNGFFNRLGPQLASFDRSRVQRLVREGGWIITGQIASVLGALALVRVLTEYLDRTQYGQLALGLTIAGLVNQTVMGPVSVGVGRFYVIAVEKRDLSGYLNGARRLLGYASICVCAIALMLIASLLQFGQTQWICLAAAALVFALLSGINSTFSGIQNAARQRSVVALHCGLDAWLKIGLAVGIMLWFGRSSAAVVMGYCLSILLVTGSQLLFLRRLIKPQLSEYHLSASESWTRQMWLFSWPFSAWGVFTWVQLSSDRWALDAYTSTANVGAYAVLFQLGYTPISVVTAFMVTFLAPILYQRSGDASVPERNAAVHRLSWRIVTAALMVTALGFVFVMAFHGWIFQLLVAGPYRSVSQWLPWMVLAGGLFAAGQVLALKLMADMRTAKTIPVKIGTAVIGAGLNVYGAAKFGLPGVVAATVVFSAIYLIWIAWLCRRPHELSIGSSRR